jgi:thiol-disulfide isomerase/thioredoxin
MKNVFCALTALALFCLIPAAQAKRAPNLELKDLSGNSHKLSELRGSIVVLNFWATWCGPCREELPLLSGLSRRYAGKKLRFVAVSLDDLRDRAKIDQFLSRQNFEMEVWIGADLDTLERAGLGNEVPATLILDEQGKIVARILGQAREEDVKRPVEWLLGGKAGPPPSALVNRYGATPAPR